MSRYFEDFVVGEVYRSQVGRTIIDADNVWFTMLTLNTNPIHFDYEYAARTEFGKPLVNSTFTLALVVGMTVADVSQNGVNLGWSSIKMPNPLFVGDTIRTATEVLETRESKSRPHMGVVTVRTRGLKQDGSVVIELERSVLVYCRGHGPEAGAQ
jgi:itaconyl-CoA hydratase